jgi:hypothetical protein
VGSGGGEWWSLLRGLVVSGGEGAGSGGVGWEVVGGLVEGEEAIPIFSLSEQGNTKCFKNNLYSITRTKKSRRIERQRYPSRHPDTTTTTRAAEQNRGKIAHLKREGDSHP